MMVTGLFAAALLLAAPARAEGDTHRQEGATIRLVVLPPDADGEVRGALSIELEPGWKTYWIAPGPVGLAPKLDLSRSTGISDASVAYPAPVRFAEGNAESIGYAEAVAFAIGARARPGVTPALRVSALLGICRELCVPVQLDLLAVPSSRLSDRALVRRAEAALPKESADLRPILHWNGDRTALLMDRESLPFAPADVFVSAGDDWSFGRPAAGVTGESGPLSLPVLSRPRADAELETVDILLTRAESAQLSRAVAIAPR